MQRMKRTITRVFALLEVLSSPGVVVWFVVPEDVLLIDLVSLVVWLEIGGVEKDEVMIVAE